ncbi:MAG: domain 2 [Verrucomicrobiota bacterium]
MSERWFVRVDEKEYGAVDLETLRDWKQEGRLLPTNEVRGEFETSWTRAEIVPGLFAPPSLPPSTRHPLDRRRTFAEIVGDSLRIYKSAFLPFFAVTLLVALPMFALELTSPAYGIFPQNSTGGGLTRANIVALVAFTLLVVNWPIFLAAIQIATVDVLEGRKVRLRELLRRAVNFFPRFAWLSLIVYGSYFFWTAVPVIAILSIVGASPSLPGILLALLLLGLQVIMVARLFANFMFWQQSAIVSGYDGVNAILESKLLARSRRRPRKLERPLWRGAFLASLWLLVVLGLSSGAEIPLVLSKLQNLTTPEEMIAALQTLNSAKTPDAILIGSAIVGGIVHALVRPILGISFVLLYFDARTDFTEAELTRKDD